MSEELEGIAFTIAGLTIAVQAVVFALSPPVSLAGVVASMGVVTALIGTLGAWRGGSS